jgi:hypothetical protein
MSRNPLHFAVFLAGLAVVAWIGAGYLGSNWLALLMSVLILACYLAGAVELHRYRQGTASLAAALASLPAPGQALEGWLQSLAPGLRPAVRQRVEGERVALPAPALTPYLVGLLVLLGMLGTLLGMMATLRGTGLALENAADLQAMRGSLAAPVHGLGFAFGTSIAGVAASSMLGLLSALCRRERLLVAAQLDQASAGPLRAWSRAHQREQAFTLLQRQAEVMPDLVERLQAMVAAIERQSETASQRLLASQQEFQARSEASQVQWASALERSMQAGVAESARALTASLQPLVEATLAGLAREGQAVHGALSQAHRQHLDDLAAGLERASSAAAGHWNQALLEQQRAGQAQVDALKGALEGFSAGFEQRSTDLVQALGERMDLTVSRIAEGWEQASARQEQAQQAQASQHAQALEAAGAALQANAAALVEQLDKGHALLQSRLGEQDEQRQQAWTRTLERIATSLAAQLQAAGEQASAQQQAWMQALEQASLQLRTQWQQAGEQAAAQQQDWAQALEATAAGLHQQWQETAQQATAQQQAVCLALEASASQISAQTQAHASQTIAEIARLVDAASEAPRAAAEVVAELRQKLSDSMVRDTAMLEERTQLIGTLGTLLEAVNHASTEQRGAIDALVATSATVLEQVGQRFSEQVQAEAGKLESVAVQMAAGAAEVGSLGEAFAGAVEQFGQTTQALAERLSSIENALERSLLRSDEQLAYYVAQAREVVELSLLSQQQILGQLQQVAAPAGTGAPA